MLTQEDVHILFNYNPYTGILTRRINVIGGKPIGSVVGTPGGKGHLRVTIDGVLYLVHRIIWLYEHGKWPKELIDHKNRNPVDNRLENLRECTYAQNNQNTPPRNGHKGVSKHGKQWSARIKINGKDEYIGFYKTPEEAALKYNIRAKEEYGEFAWLNE